MPIKSFFSLHDRDMDQAFGESLRWLGGGSTMPAAIIHSLGDRPRGAGEGAGRSGGGGAARSRRRRSRFPTAPRPIALVAFGDAKAAPFLRALFGTGRSEAPPDLADAARTDARRVAAATTDLEPDDAEDGALFVAISTSGLHGGPHTLRCEVGVRRADTADPRLGPGWRVTCVQAISQQS